MSTPVLLWFTLGLFIGAAHVWSLWRAIQHVSPYSPLLGLLRLAVVSAILLAAARNGGILPTCAGWALAFPAAALPLWVGGRAP
jgi:Mg/Co/Ni transporter MgtE